MRELQSTLPDVSPAAHDVVRWLQLCSTTLERYPQ